MTSYKRGAWYYMLDKHNHEPYADLYPTFYHENVVKYYNSKTSPFRTERDD